MSERRNLAFRKSQHIQLIQRLHEFRQAEDALTLGEDVSNNSQNVIKKQVTVHCHADLNCNINCKRQLARLRSAPIFQRDFNKARLFGIWTLQRNNNCCASLSPRPTNKAR